MAIAIIGGTDLHRSRPRWSRRARRARRAQCAEQHQEIVLACHITENQDQLFRRFDRGRWLERNLVGLGLPYPAPIGAERDSQFDQFLVDVLYLMNWMVQPDDLQPRLPRRMHHSRTPTGTDIDASPRTHLSLRHAYDAVRPTTSGSQGEMMKYVHHPRLDPLTPRPRPEPPVRLPLYCVDLHRDAFSRGTSAMFMRLSIKISPGHRRPAR